jgi:hypothetical protein
MSEAQHYSEYFETRQPAEAARGFIQSWHTRMLRSLQRLIPGLAQLRVLEVGAGWGYFARACRQRGIAYAGIELNAEQAARLREEGFDVVATSIPPFPTGAPVQLIYMSHVLEHATSYLHALEMLTAARERLDARGYVAVICPDLLSWKEEFWNGDWSHGFPTTLRRLEQIVAEAGFEIVDARHHTAGFTQPAAAFVATQLTHLIPVRALDMIFKPLTKRTLAYSFMTVFGWRQLLVVGRKK